MKEVYLLYGYYSDKSGGVLFGVFDLPSDANERADMLKAAGSPYQIRVVGAIVGKSEAQELF